MKGRAGMVLTAAWFCAAAQGQGTDTNAVLDSWFAAQSNTRAWRAEFTQTRALTELTSLGKAKAEPARWLERLAQRAASEAWSVERESVAEGHRHCLGNPWERSERQ